MRAGDSPWRTETVAIHGGYEPETPSYPCAVPIVQSAAFQFESSDHAAELFALRREGSVYSRIMNPTVDAFERRMAHLEGGVSALATASGQAAAALTTMLLCRAGDEIVVSTSLYGGIYNLFRNTVARMGITPRFVCPRDPSNFADAITPRTRMIYAEAVGNPTVDTPDIEAVARIAHAAQVPFVLDNTIPTPALLRPFDWGVDISISSTTKYIGGHGTAIGGVIVDSGRFDWTTGHFPSLTEPDPTNNDIVYTEIFGPAAFITACRAQMMREIGACMSPHTAFLMLMGLDTLPLRMERHSRNGEDVADFLANHPEVTWVLYPGRPDHPTHAFAKRYLNGGFTGMLAFGVRDGIKHGRRLSEAVRLIKHAAHLGDVRSLIIHPATTTHSQMSAETRRLSGIGDDFMRLSVGLEHVDDIIADLDQALRA